MSECVDRAGRAEAWRALLSQLPGVYAAGVQLDEAGAPLEIHVLASLARNPKQIARDVQSALFAAYGIPVDHRIISIAQLARSPLEEPAAGGARLRISGLDCRREDGRFSARVQLSLKDCAMSGEESCRDVEPRRSRAIAEATLSAVHAFLDAEMFALLELRKTAVWGGTVWLAVVESDGDTLVGAALEAEDPFLTVVRATLSAINRRVSGLNPHPPASE